MKKWHVVGISVLALAGAVGLNAQGSTEQVPTFSKLQQGDSLSVEFTSFGCFHGEQYQVKFTRGAKLTAQVVAVEREHLPDGTVKTKTKHLGDLTLSQDDAKGLDSLLGFYRSKPRNGCTTVDTMKISHLKGEKTLASETYIDGSCSYDRKGMLRISELVSRLTKR